MPSGGARLGAGRPRGSRNKDADGNVILPMRDVVSKAYGENLSPLQLMEAIMRDPKAPLMLRLMAAKEAAPYCHAKAGTTPKGNAHNPHAATDEDRPRDANDPSGFADLLKRIN